MQRLEISTNDILEIDFIDIFDKIVLFVILDFKKYRGRKKVAIEIKLFFKKDDFWAIDETSVKINAPILLQPLWWRTHHTSEL